MLLNGAKFSYLTTNYQAGIGTFNILNANDGFSVGTPVLLGGFGSRNAEMVQVASVNTSTGVLTFTTNTIFAHPESTRVTALPYDQVRFFWTSTSTFDTNNPLTGYQSLQAGDWVSTYKDEANATGYGWYVFYNSVTTILSATSNAIPYAGFGTTNVETIIEDFFSMLNDNQVKRIKRTEVIAWMREGYNIMSNKLNLSNREFATSTTVNLSLIPGTSEYDLPAKFDKLIAIATAGVNSPTATNPARDIPFIPIEQILSYPGPELRYYIRGSKLGFVPQLTGTTQVQYMYMARPDDISSNFDTINLPNNGESALKDFMLYRANQKLKDPDSAMYYKSFADWLNSMVAASIDRDANLDSFQPAHEASV